MISFDDDVDDNSISCSGVDKKNGSTIGEASV